MKEVLFLIHDLGVGGAQAVLVNLVNNLDPTKFRITISPLFGGGVYEQYLMPHLVLRPVFRKTIPANSKLMKIFTPSQLYRMIVKEHYDIEVAYLEGPDSRIISGCNDKTSKTVNWVHGELGSRRNASRSFRNVEEAEECYNKFNRTICVSQTVKEDFSSLFQINHPCDVLYNTVESEIIIQKAKDHVSGIKEDRSFKIIAIGTLKEVKGFERLLNICLKLREDGKNIHLYIIGDGPQRDKLTDYISVNKLDNTVTMLGYQSNPYKYLSKCDLFVCSSYREGFSTAATEALIVGTPVCTTEVSGMREMLGSNNDWGVITENNEQALYKGIKELIEKPEMLAQYKLRARERGRMFSTEKTVLAVEEMLLSLCS